MDYFQGVVTEYLQEKLSLFVKTECCISLDKDGKLLKGRHWFCDAVAVDFRNKTIYLCEVTYSKSLQALIVRLKAWNNHWSSLCDAIQRDYSVPDDWTVQPWVFIPNELRGNLSSKLVAIGINPQTPNPMPYPKVMDLEEVVPWKL